MDTKFSVGQTVRVTDQYTPATGKIKKVSTWREVNGPGSTDAPCYFVHCTSWVEGYWIDERFLQEV